MAKEPVAITGLWLRHIGSSLEVLVEIEGTWRKVIEEHDGGMVANPSHIAEASAIRSAPVDDLTVPERPENA